MSTFSFAEKKPLTVALVGGGIGGLCLAVGLQKHNVDFHIYEAAKQFSEIGAGVGFAPNAQRAMDLIDPRITAGFAKHATYNYHEEQKGSYFQFRMGMDGRANTNTAGLKANDVISDPKTEGEGMCMIHRARFLDEVASLIPKQRTTFGKRLDRLENLADSVRMHFSDGTTAEASIVIGCDGVKSKVRRTLFGPESDAKFSGKYAYRGLIPMQKVVDKLGEELARNSQLYVGYEGHMLTIQVERGSLMNVVAFRTKADGKWDHEQWVLPVKREDMMADFEEWSPTVKSVLNLLEKPETWALFEHPPIDAFYKGRVCVMGDAAHATTPHQGSGAGMAIEDAYILSNMIGQMRHADDYEASFSAYNKIRHTRGMDLVTTSHAAGEVYEFQGATTGDDAQKIDQHLSVRYHWIWREDLEGELKQATNLVEQSRSQVSSVPSWLRRSSAIEVEAVKERVVSITTSVLELQLQEIAEISDDESVVQIANPLEGMVEIVA